jgi:hypothetical protein
MRGPVGIFDLGAVGEASMAAGPVGIAGGVLGGKILLDAGSNRFDERADNIDGPTGFGTNCLCRIFLLSAPGPAIDSQLSLRDRPMTELACDSDVELVAARMGRACTSDFARRSTA